MIFEITQFLEEENYNLIQQNVVKISKCPSTNS